MIIDDVLTLQANWATPVGIRRTWRTNIQSSVNGSEKRSAMFSWARRTMIYDVLAVSAAESNELKRRLYKNLHLIWGIPVWPDRTWLTAQALAGQPILQVESTQNRQFELGGPCIILKSGEYELCEIDTISDTQITVKDNLSLTWSADTEVYPLLEARLSPSQKISMVSGSVGEMQITASEVFDQDITRTAGNIDSFSTYAGLPVFNLEPNWIEPVQLDPTRPYDFLKYFGKEYSVSYVDESIFKIQAKYLTPSRDELAAVTSFFDWCKGRQGRFFIPSWQRDVVVTQAFLSSATELTIENIDWPGSWQINTTAGHYIFMRFPDQTEVIREITGASDTTHITLDYAVGKACTEDELRGLHISFLFLTRFDQDEINIQYAGETISEFALKFSTLAEAL